MNAFEKLSSAADGPDRLAAEYDLFIRALITAPFWTSGAVGDRRVRWTDGRDARKEDRLSFGAPGLYIWGARDRPLYIGITVGRSAPGSFSKRFSRYIWQTRSQCNLAQLYSPQLVSAGLAGFPEEVREWYRKGHGSGTTRLNGAVRFAEEGIDDVWFALLPKSGSGAVGQLEAALIPVAEAWNAANGNPSLVNIQKKTAASRTGRRSKASGSGQ